MPSFLYLSAYVCVYKLLWWCWKGEQSLAEDPGGQVCSIAAHPGWAALISPVSSSMPLPSWQLLLLHSLWVAETRRWRHFFTSLQQGCPFTGPDVNLWSWIYRGKLWILASALCAAWPFVPCIHLHICFISHKSWGMGEFRLIVWGF